MDSRSLEGSFELNFSPQTGLVWNNCRQRLHVLNPTSENVVCMDVQGEESAAVSQQSQGVPFIEQDSNRV